MGENGGEEPAHLFCRVASVGLLRTFPMFLELGIETQGEFSRKFSRKREGMAKGCPESAENGDRIHAF